MKFKIVKNAKGGFDLVAGDKIIAHYDTEQLANDALAATQGDDADDIDGKIAQIANSAVASQLKRLAKDNEKIIKDAVTAALAGLKPDTTTTTDGSGGAPGTAGGAGKGDPEVVLLREKLAKVEKAQLDAENRAKAVEDRSRKDSARSELRTALDAKGIKGARATALIAHLELTGALRVNEDGKTELGVTRARIKGGDAQELAFGIAAGVDDWCKTDDAKEFLPAPTTTQTRQAGARPQMQTATGRAPTARAAPTNFAQGVEAAAEQLARAGVDLDSIVDS